MAATIQGDMISDVFLALTDDLRKEFERKARIIMLRTLNPQNIQGSQVTYIASMLAAGREMSEIYTMASVNYMLMFNEAEGIDVPKRDIEKSIVPFDEPSFTQRMIGAGIYGYQRKLSQVGVPMRLTPNNPLDNKMFMQSVNNVSMDFGKHMMTAGRNTITKATEELSVYQGWGRNVSTGACDFCMMLATRDNYKSQKSAGFEAHRSCSCAPEPITVNWQPSPENLKAYGRFLDKEERLNEKLGKENRAEIRRDRRDAREVNRGDISAEHKDSRKAERTARQDKKLLDSQLENGMMDKKSYDKAVQEIEFERVDRTKFYQEKKAGDDFLEGKFSDEEYQQKLKSIQQRAEEKKTKLKPEGYGDFGSQKSVATSLLGK